MSTWNPFDPLLPATGGPTRQEDITAIRNNLLALRAMMAAGGSPYGWGRTQTGPDGEPTADIFAKGTERIRISFTWGTTGGADGNTTKEVYEYSADSGSNYYPMLDSEGNYVATYTYSTAFICTSESWGATP